MKSLNKIVLLIIFIFSGLAACGDDSQNKSDSRSFGAGNVSKASKQDIHETFLAGKISGTLNGTEFSIGGPKSRESKIRTTGNQKSLILTFATNTYTAVIIVGDYHGEGAYQDKMSLSPFMLMAKPRDKYKTLEKTLNVTEDNKEKIIGTFSFKVESATNENTIVDGNFEFKKIVIDISDDAGLLSELKDNAAFMRSLGKRRADKGFVIKAIQQNSLAFRYIDDGLKKDKEFVLRALKEGPKKMPAFLIHADKELLQDKDFALKMLAIKPLAIHFLDRELKKDEDVIKASEK